MKLFIPPRQWQMVSRQHIWILLCRRDARAAGWSLDQLWQDCCESHQSYRTVMRYGQQQSISEASRQAVWRIPTQYNPATASGTQERPATAGSQWPGWRQSARTDVDVYKPEAACRPKQYTEMPNTYYGIRLKFKRLSMPCLTWTV
jgi:hypothetical protein